MLPMVGLCFPAEEKSDPPPVRRAFGFDGGGGRGPVWFVVGRWAAGGAEEDVGGWAMLGRGLA